MKKWLIGFLILTVLFLLTAYVVIPSKLTVSANVIIKANADGAYRCLMNENKWEKLFGERAGENGFQNNNITFIIKKKLLDGAEILIKNNDDEILSTLKILRISRDSSLANWSTSLESSTNPVKKIQQYFAGLALKKNMIALLDSMKRFMEKQENIYDIEVKKTLVKDTLLVSTKKVFDDYPSIEDVYSLITELKNYIVAKGAEETGYPMLNITTTDSTNFLTRVAIPINKSINGNNDVEIKRMVPGNILVTVVTGGPYTVARAFKNLEHFKEDYGFTSPAIPFESLITDRLKEKDTAKRVTKIYYPVY